MEDGKIKYFQTLNTCIIFIPRVCNICPGSGVGVVGGLPGVQRREDGRALQLRKHRTLPAHASQLRENSPGPRHPSLSVSSCDHLKYDHHVIISNMIILTMCHASRSQAQL